MRSATIAKASDGGKVGATSSRTVISRDLPPDLKHAVASLIKSLHTTSHSTTARNAAAQDTPAYVSLSRLQHALETTGLAARLEERGFRRPFTYIPAIAGIAILDNIINREAAIMAAVNPFVTLEDIERAVVAAVNRLGRQQEIPLAVTAFSQLNIGSLAAAPIIQRLFVAKHYEEAVSLPPDVLMAAVDALPIETFETDRSWKPVVDIAAGLLGVPVDCIRVPRKLPPVKLIADRIAAEQKKKQQLLLQAAAKQRKEARAAKKSKRAVTFTSMAGDSDEEIDVLESAGCTTPMMDTDFKVSSDPSDTVPIHNMPLGERKATKRVVDDPTAVAAELQAMCKHIASNISIKELIAIAAGAEYARSLHIGSFDELGLGPPSEMQMPPMQELGTMQENALSDIIKIMSDMEKGYSSQLCTAIVQAARRCEELFPPESSEWTAERRLTTIGHALQAVLGTSVAVPDRFLVSSADAGTVAPLRQAAVTRCERLPALLFDAAECSLGSTYLSETDIIALISAAPFLTSLESYLGWDPTLATTYGSVAKFVLRAQQSGALSDITLMQGPIGCWFKIKPDDQCSGSAFSSACARGSIDDAALQLVSLVGSQDSAEGVEAAVQQVLGAWADSKLTQRVYAHGGNNTFFFLLLVSVWTAIPAAFQVMLGARIILTLATTNHTSTLADFVQYSLRYALGDAGDFSNHHATMDMPSATAVARLPLLPALRIYSRLGPHQQMQAENPIRLVLDRARSSQREVYMQHPDTNTEGAMVMDTVTLTALETAMERVSLGPVDEATLEPRPEAVAPFDDGDAREASKRSYIIIKEADGEAVAEVGAGKVPAYEPSSAIISDPALEDGYPDSPQDAQHLISEIRRAWLEGAEGNSIAHRAAVRGTERLSGELYREAIHFLYEIIQNSDDNLYDNNGSKPTLTISLHHHEGQPSELVIENNERGFRRSDVRSICGTGESTKQSLEGYIGKKGIGWKSVFAVSRQPQIHSRFLHFVFDTRGPDESDNGLGELGRLCPAWLSRASGSEYTNGTQIVLPLDQKEEGDSDPFWGARLAPALRNLTATPEILLFMRKLGALKVQEIDSSGTVVWHRSIERDRATEAVFYKRCGEIAAGGKDGTATYTAKSVTFRTSSSGSDTELTYCLLAADVPTALGPPQRTKSASSTSCTQVIAAFNVDAVFSHPDRLPTCHVYSFLPVDDFGLKFALNADWLLPSTREHLKLDSTWNRWIAVSIVPQLVLEMLPVLSLLAESQDVGATRKFQSASPRPNGTKQQLCVLTAKAFFSLLFAPTVATARARNSLLDAAARSIFSKLRTLPCIPTADGNLVSPPSALLCIPSNDIEEYTLHDLVSSIIPSGTPGLEDLLGLHMVHGEFQPSDEYVELLGIETWSLTHALRVIRQPIPNQSAGIAANERFLDICRLIWYSSRDDRGRRLPDAQCKDRIARGLAGSEAPFIPVELLKGGREFVPIAWHPNTVVVYLSSGLAERARVNSLLQRFNGQQHRIPMLSTEIAKLLSTNAWLRKVLPWLNIVEFTFRVPVDGPIALFFEECDTWSQPVTEAQHASLVAAGELLVEWLSQCRSLAAVRLSPQYNKVMARAVFMTDEGMLLRARQNDAKTAPAAAKAAGSVPCAFLHHRLFPIGTSYSSAMDDVHKALTEARSMLPSSTKLRYREGEEEVDVGWHVLHKDYAFSASSLEALHALGISHFFTGSPCRCHSGAVHEVEPSHAELVQLVEAVGHRLSTDITDVTLCAALHRALRAIFKIYISHSASHSQGDALNALKHVRWIPCTLPLHGTDCFVTPVQAVYPSPALVRRFGNVMPWIDLSDKEIQSSEVERIMGHLGCEFQVAPYQCAEALLRISQKANEAGTVVRVQQDWRAQLFQASKASLGDGFIQASISVLRELYSSLQVDQITQELPLFLPDCGDAESPTALPSGLFRGRFAELKAARVIHDDGAEGTLRMFGVWSAWQVGSMDPVSLHVNESLYRDSPSIMNAIRKVSHGGSEMSSILQCLELAQNFFHSSRTDAERAVVRNKIVKVLFRGAAQHAELRGRQQPSLEATTEKAPVSYCIKGAISRGEQPLLIPVCKLMKRDAVSAGTHALPMVDGDAGVASCVDDAVWLDTVELITPSSDNMPLYIVITQPVPDLEQVKSLIACSWPGSVRGPESVIPGPCLIELYKLQADDGVFQQAVAVRMLNSTSDMLKSHRKINPVMFETLEKQVAASPGFVGFEEMVPVVKCLLARTIYCIQQIMKDRFSFEHQQLHRAGVQRRLHDLVGSPCGLVASPYRLEVSTVGTRSDGTLATVWNTAHPVYIHFDRASAATMLYLEASCIPAIPLETPVFTQAVLDFILQMLSTSCQTAHGDSARWEQMVVEIKKGMRTEWKATKWDSVSSSTLSGAHLDHWCVLGDVMVDLKPSPETERAQEVTYCNTTDVADIRMLETVATLLGGTASTEVLVCGDEAPIVELSSLEAIAKAENKRMQALGWSGTRQQFTAEPLLASYRPLFPQVTAHVTEPASDDGPIVVAPSSSLPYTVHAHVPSPADTATEHPTSEDVPTVPDELTIEPLADVPVPEQVLSTQPSTVPETSRILPLDQPISPSDLPDNITPQIALALSRVSSPACAQIVREVMKHRHSTLHKTPDESASDKELGRKGEEIVFRYLQNLHQKDGRVVEWVNQYAEVEQPFDLRITERDTAAVIKFVEVKTTRKPSFLRGSLRFNMSFAQVSLAYQAKDAFDMWFVTGLGSADETNVSLFTVPYPAHHIRPPYGALLVEIYNLPDSMPHSQDVVEVGSLGGLPVRKTPEAVTMERNSTETANPRPADKPTDDIPVSSEALVLSRHDGKNHAVAGRPDASVAQEVLAKAATSGTTMPINEAMAKLNTKDAVIEYILPLGDEGILLSKLGSLMDSALRGNKTLTAYLQTIGLTVFSVNGGARVRYTVQDSTPTLKAATTHNLQEGAPAVKATIAGPPTAPTAAEHPAKLDTDDAVIRYVCSFGQKGVRLTQIAEVMNCALRGSNTLIAYLESIGLDVFRVDGRTLARHNVHGAPSTVVPMKAASLFGALPDCLVAHATGAAPVAAMDSVDPYRRSAVEEQTSPTARQPKAASLPTKGGSPLVATVPVNRDKISTKDAVIKYVRSYGKQGIHLAQVGELVDSKLRGASTLRAFLESIGLSVSVHNGTACVRYAHDDHATKPLILSATAPRSRDVHPACAAVNTTPSDATTAVQRAGSLAHSSMTESTAALPQHAATKATSPGFPPIPTSAPGVVVKFKTKDEVIRYVGCFDDDGVLLSNLGTLIDSSLRGSKLLRAFLESIGLTVFIQGSTARVRCDAHVAMPAAIPAHGSLEKNTGSVISPATLAGPVAVVPSTHPSAHPSKALQDSTTIRQPKPGPHLAPAVFPPIPVAASEDCVKLNTNSAVINYVRGHGKDGVLLSHIGGLIHSSLRGDNPLELYLQSIGLTVFSVDGEARVRHSALVQIPVGVSAKAPSSIETKHANTGAAVAVRRSKLNTNDAVIEYVGKCGREGVLLSQLGELMNSSLRGGDTLKAYLESMGLNVFMDKGAARVRR